ncbi:HNH endonuclease [Sedimentitalea sp. JM2-8]|uniref:HNH endonuclease n=1 Tax=Sedimentitalea xiamensis TaxID=3050037 RepID=A0ABT7F903_9RHOB|nr:HNH endonuclease [Sedimentitalea xiamensis]MDK3071589.1 HNH endonuclease [Sedimentitalea xiamensis]
MSDPGPYPLCPLCQRPIPPGVPQSRHHLVPRLKGGKGGPTVLLHHICHKEIHASLSEAELARSYDSIDALRAHPRLEKFVAWVRKRPPDFQSRVPGTRRNG